MVSHHRNQNKLTDTDSCQIQNSMHKLLSNSQEFINQTWTRGDYQFQTDVAWL